MLERHASSIVLHYSMQETCDRALSIGQHAPAKLMQPGIWRRNRSRMCGVCNLARGRSEAEGQSFEAEFRKYADLDRVQRASQHLELTWKVSKVTQQSTRWHTSRTPNIL